MNKFYNTLIILASWNSQSKTDKTPAGSQIAMPNFAAFHVPRNKCLIWFLNFYFLSEIASLAFVGFSEFTIWLLSFSASSTAASPISTSFSDSPPFGLATADSGFSSVLNYKLAWFLHNWYLFCKSCPTWKQAKNQVDYQLRKHFIVRKCKFGRICVTSQFTFSSVLEYFFPTALFISRCLLSFCYWHKRATISYNFLRNLHGLKNSIWVYVKNKICVGNLKMNHLWWFTSWKCSKISQKWF